MPINCPLSYSGLCPECTNLYNKLCYARPLRPIPIVDILTNEERITILEDRLEEQSEYAPKKVIARVLKENEALKGEVLWLRNKLIEHLDKSAELRKKKKSKYE